MHVAADLDALRCCAYQKETHSNITIPHAPRRPVVEVTSRRVTVPRSVAKELPPAAGAVLAGTILAAPWPSQSFERSPEGSEAALNELSFLCLPQKSPNVHFAPHN